MKTGNLWLSVLLVFLPVACVTAQDFPSGTSASPSTANVDLSNFLGMLPSETYDLLGAPQEVLASKTGDDIIQVVHFYSEFVYLFWYKNRVWQIRVDQRFQGRFMGLSMGMSREQVESLIGPPRYRDENWFTYELPVLGFPRRLRLKFTNNRLNDLYYYRSDL